MKFTVLCVLDLEHVPNPRGVLDGLAGLGFQPVETTTTPRGRQLGPRGCVIGVFRACDPHVLEYQLRADVATRLRRMQVDASFHLCVQALEEQEPESMALRVGS
jgi:hypothetical protein